MLCLYTRYSFGLHGLNPFLLGRQPPPLPPASAAGAPADGAGSDAGAGAGATPAPSTGTGTGTGTGSAPTAPGSTATPAASGTGTGSMPALGGGQQPGAPGQMDMNMMMQMMRAMGGMGGAGGMGGGGGMAPGAGGLPTRPSAVCSPFTSSITGNFFDECRVLFLCQSQYRNFFKISGIASFHSSYNNENEPRFYCSMHVKMFTFRGSLLNCLLTSKRIL